MVVSVKGGENLKEQRRKADIARQAYQEEQARRARRQDFLKREERRRIFVDDVAAKLAERTRLRNVLSHVQTVAAASSPNVRASAAWLGRRLAEIDALLSSEFMELPIQRAKIEFNEAVAGATSGQEGWYYLPSSTLEFWDVDKNTGRPNTQDSFEWATRAGLLPDIEEPIEAKDRSG